MRLIQACARIPRSLMAVFGILFLSAVLSGCGSKYVSSPPSQNLLSITINEPTTSVSGGQSLQFTASISSPTSGSIVWSVTGGGTISATGLYSAPVSVIANTPVTVTATLSTNSVISSSQTITVIPPPAVSISEPAPSVVAGQTLQFTANIGGPGSAVVWSLTSGPGSISQTGLYTAPPASTITANTTVTVTATLANNSSVSATESITLYPAPSIAIAPPSTTVNLGQSMQLAANIVGSTGTPVWSISSGPGTISPAGVYTAPATMPANAVVTVVATLSNNANIVATKNLTVVDPATLTVLPQIATVNTNQPIQFTATIGQSAGTVVWSLSGAGTLTPTGLYTAPTGLPANPNVTVTATMSNDSSIVASQTFTLYATPAITISAPSTTLATGSTMLFTADVMGIVDGVTWTSSTNTASCATSPTTAGCISSFQLSNNNIRYAPPPGTYTAPATVPAPATVTITATLNSKPSVSASTTITIVGPPTITSTTPASLPTGQNNPVTVNGTGFTPGVQVLVNGLAVPTTYVSPTQANITVSAEPSFVTATIPALGTILLVAQNTNGYSYAGTSAGYDMPVTAPSSTSTVAIGSTPGLAIPPGFVGLSHENGDGQWNMGDNARGVNQAYRNLVGYLMDTPNSPFLVRIGGGTTDATSAPNDETPQSVEELNELHAAIPGVTATIGLILDKDSFSFSNSQSVPRTAADNALYYESQFNPGVLDSFEIGNEVDAYMYAGGNNGVGIPYADYTFDDYLGNYVGWAQSVLDTVYPLAPKFCGSGFASPRAMVNNWYWSNTNEWQGTGYMPIYIPAVKNFNKTITYHFYSDKGVAQPSVGFLTGAWLLGQPLKNGTAQYPGPLQYVDPNPGGSVVSPLYWAPALYGQQAALAHQNGMTFRINEFNTVSGGGIVGGSEAFAASLWAVDTMFEFASNGVDGVNYHGATGGTRQLTGTCSVDGGIVENAPCIPKPLYAPWTFYVHSGNPDTYTLESVNPEYYGMYFFHKAVPDGSKLLPVQFQSPAYVKVWATQAPDGSIRVAIVNKDITNNVNLTINLPGHGNAQTMLMQTSNTGGWSGDLMFPNNTSLIGTTGITVGGQTWDGSTDGTIQGTQTLGSITPSNGNYTVSVNATSAVLLTIPQ